MTIIFKILQVAEWKAMGSSPLSRLLKNNVSFLKSLIKIHVPDILLITSADCRSSVVVY
jgi:hypothetical protein